MSWGCPCASRNITRSSPSSLTGRGSLAFSSRDNAAGCQYERLNAPPGVPRPVRLMSSLVSLLNISACPPGHCSPQETRCERHFSSISYFGPPEASVWLRNLAHRSQRYGYRLGLKESLNPLAPVLAPPPRLLVSAKRYICIERRAAVDQHGAGAELARQLMCHADILGPDVGRQAVLRVVAQGCEVFQVLIIHGHGTQHRPKNLFA